MAKPAPPSGENVEKPSNGLREHLVNDKLAGDSQNKAVSEKVRLQNAVSSKPEKALENGNPGSKECLEVA